MTFMDSLRRLVVLGLVGTVAACAGPGPPSAYRPSSPPTARALVDDFLLEIASPRDTWQAGEPISVTASLTYLGTGATTVIGAGSGPIAFGVREVGGTREMAALLTYDAVPHRIGPEPYLVEYRKSGGWSPGDDPNEAFYEEFFADPEFRLPPGSWEITAWARFATQDGGPYTVDTRVGLVISVE